MTLSIEVTYSPIRLIGDRKTEGGVFYRGTIGTGFVLHVPGETDPKIRHGYLLTAAHVIADQPNVEMQPAKRDGSLYDPISVRDWDIPVKTLDLAISPTRDLPDGQAYWANPLELSVPIGAITTVAPGDPIYYVGIFEPIDKMMVRSGTIGAVDQAGLKFDAFPQFDYPCHLVDCRSYNGFSGSPCFLGKEYPDLRESVWPLTDEFPAHTDHLGTMAYVIIFAGMFTSHFSDSDDHEPGKVTSRYGVGVMLRSQEIREVLMSDSLKQTRLEKEQDIQKRRPGPILKATGAGDTVFGRDAFEHALEKATRKVTPPAESAPEG